MTDTTPNAPASEPAPLPDFDPAKTYDVKLKRSVEWPVGSGFFHRPIDHQLFNGAVCKEIVNGIYSAKQV